MDDVIDRIRRAVHTLRPAEARVARAVLDDPDAALRSTVASLAASAEAS